MIDIIKSKITTSILHKDLENITSGAIVTFEGRVRNHNKGKEITNLYYECYYPMALKVMTEVKEETIKTFNITNISAVHRVGDIPIGDIAVWIGVSAIHRKDAFKACEFMINEIKHKVPIWKKETYKDGTLLWVECCH